MNVPGGFTYAPWLAVLLVPVGMAALLLVRSWRTPVMFLAPAAALPGLLLALTADAGTVVDLPWVLVGLRFGLDATARVLLMLTSALYLAIGVDALFAVRHRRVEYRFFAYYLFAMSGNLGLIVAQDAVSFYTLFAVMSLSAFGLVVHSHTSAARHAGRVYIVMVMLSEVLIFAALVMAVAGGSHYLADLPQQVLQSSRRSVIVGLLVAGFGVKVGLFPLHVWLPVAYRAAPLPASALLSACMSKAGVLGWMRCLPVVDAGMPGWGGLLAAGGLFAALYALVTGVNQRDPKAVLAYSSMSKMGVVTALLGMSLYAPEARTVAWGAALVYVLHHAAAKAALFLGLGILHNLPRGRMARLGVGCGMVLPALALSGLPFTSGRVAKLAFKKAGHAAVPAMETLWAWLLPALSLLTVLVMARFLLLAWRERRAPAEATHLSGQAIPWAVILAGLVLLPVVFRACDLAGLPPEHVTFHGVWNGTWPLLLGFLIAWAAWAWGRGPVPVPCGDILVLCEQALRTMPRALPAGLRRWVAREYSAGLSLLHWLTARAPHPQGGRLLAALEMHLRSWPVLGSLLLLVVAAAFLLTRMP